MNNKIKLHILGVAVNKLGNWLLKLRTTGATSGGLKLQCITIVATFSSYAC